MRTSFGQSEYEYTSFIIYKQKSQMEGCNQDCPSRGAKQDQLEYNHLYFDKFCKAYEVSLRLSNYLDQTNRRQSDILQKIQALSERIDDLRDPIRRPMPEKKRKQRRAADEINKEFICAVENCQHGYASMASLKIHQKLKHPEMASPEGEIRSDSLNSES